LWRENEVLPENPYIGCTVLRPDVLLVVTRQTYAPEPRHMVTVWQGNSIFTKRPIAPVFIDLGLFSGTKTNRRFSIGLENSDLLKFSETHIDPGEF
jgi:hypothetical protein